MKAHVVYAHIYHGHSDTGVTRDPHTPESYLAEYDPKHYAPVAEFLTYGEAIDFSLWLRDQVQS